MASIATGFRKSSGNQLALKGENTRPVNSNNKKRPTVKLGLLIKNDCMNFTTEST